MREWLLNNGFQVHGAADQQIPEMTPEVVKRISDRYIELYEHITGTSFIPAPADNVLGRIEQNVKAYLAS